MQRLIAPLILVLLVPAGAAAQDIQTVPTPEGPPISMYVGVSGAANVNSAGGSFGYHLDATIGLSVDRFSFEVLAGTATLNTDDGELSGAHVGAAVRVDVLSRPTFGLQLGTGLRRHAWRSVQGRNAYPLGVLGSVRVYAPLSDYARAHFDFEYERQRSTAATDSAHVIAIGFGVTTHFGIR